MPACISCNRETSASVSASGLCQACATASLRSKSPAVAASMLCGRPPELAIWWQSLTKTDIPAEDGERVLGYAVGSLLLGPAGAALGGAIAASAGAQAVYSSRIGIVAVEPEAVWVLECANLFLGSASRLEEHHLATMLIAWQTGNYAPETTRIPISQVSCRADAEGLVLQYGPRVWTIRPFGAPHLVPSQPGLNEALSAINGGIAVPPLKEFMKMMTSAGDPLQPRLLDAVAADSGYMNRVLSSAAMLNRKRRGVFLDKSAQTPSGFRILVGAWVSERAEGVARLARAAYLSLGVCVASILFLTLDPPSEWGRPPASAVLAFLAAAISLPLGALRVFQHLRAKWFQAQLPKFRTGAEK